MAGAKTNSKCEEDDYSEITQKILGRNERVFLYIYSNCNYLVYKEIFMDFNNLFFIY